MHKLLFYTERTLLLLWAGDRQGGAGVAWNVGGGVSDHGGGQQCVYVVGPLGR